MLLEVKNLNVSFLVKGKKINVVRGVDYYVNEGEILGILGESGSGKTIVSTCCMPSIKEENYMQNSGNIVLNGKPSYIFQNATLALNPYKKIKNQMAHSASTEKIMSSLEEVGFEHPQDVLNLFPHQLSGGQCQKIAIAQALMQHPDLLIADEPTSSVDASIKYKILDLLRDINKKHNTAIIFISHDFDAVKYICNRVIIMYGGLIMEQGNMEEITASPLHPYTKELYKCAESLKQATGTLHTMVGKTINATEFKNECPFKDRCRQAKDICSKEIPKLAQISDGRKVRCVNYYGK